MNTFFAAAFPSFNSAEEAQRFVEKLNDEGLLSVIASVVIAKSKDGEISQHHGRAPGAVAAGLMGLIGGLVGLVGGPLRARPG